MATTHPSNPLSPKRGRRSHHASAFRDLESGWVSGTQAMRLGVPWGSGCLVRAGHTGLSWGITVGLFLHSTDLRRQEEQGELLHPLLFVSLVLCSLLLYFIVSLMDPGYVKHDGDEKEAVKEEQQAMIPQQVPTTVWLRRCGYCLLKQPMRAKHCRECQHCVRRYDHHCLWIGNCVGERNHPLFIVYLAVQLVVLLWALQVAWSGLTFELSWVWLHHNGLLLLSFLVIAVFIMVVTLLLISHLYLASCNTTSWEFMSHHRISYLRRYEEENPFDQGVLRNLWLFFCACRLVTWENLYFPEESNAV